MKIAADWVLRNIGQLLTMCPGSGGSTTEATHLLGIRDQAALGITGSQLVWIGPDRELAEAVSLPDALHCLDVGGRAVLPGLVDCHTHLVFAGSRAHEFSQRIEGRSYEEILASGGGIHSTVQATRQAREEELVKLALARLERFASFGVTTVEVKSGYGLDLETELKILRVVKRLQALQPLDLVPTFMGAHTVPKEYQQQRHRYLDLILKQMIPQVAQEGLARFCDVFCEQGAFNLEESRRILTAALDAGLRPKLHAEQLSRSNSIPLAVELNAVSVDHLEFATAEDASLLAASSTIPVFLPGATYFAGKNRYAPAAIFQQAGCPVAVSTDFNPGTCMSENLPLMLNLAGVCCRLPPALALLGATRYAARALDLGGAVGTLEPGKQADLLILDCSDWRELIYHFGVRHTWRVFKAGKPMYPAPSPGASNQTGVC